MIRWKRSQDGYTNSVENRFCIQPQFRGRTTWDSYQMDDLVTGKKYRGDTQRELKLVAEEIVTKETPEGVANL